jgi:hypothetical protein
MMIEQYGSGSGSIPLTSGSGSGRPKKYVDPVDPDPDSDPEHWIRNTGYKDPDRSLRSGTLFF